MTQIFKLSFSSFFILLSTTLFCQKIPNINVSESQLEFLGKTDPIRELIKIGPTTAEQKAEYKKHRTKPENFKGRGYSKVLFPELEHQGPDPLRKISTQRSPDDSIIPDVNINGLGPFGSPHDPTGDVGGKYYLQASNLTFVNVYNKDGSLVESFSMNTLWDNFNVRSGGDPIILYDETAERWFLSEFTRRGELLIAISETSDPLNSYFVYRFQTPEFPDYPKYGIYPGSYSLTTNEGGTGVLHHYFFERAALITGAEEVRMQRIEVQGNLNTEAGFFVATPVDWNGDLSGLDERPISLVLNDSSWGAVAQDQIELYAFSIDWENVENTIVEKQSIINTPFDSNPCSSLDSIFFSCVPQRGNAVDLDGLPELIVNVPHHRHFVDHESIVFTFITDVTDGENLSGIRWTELRRYYGQDWMLYQEGTFAPDNSVDRYMAGIAIDKYGDIGMAYNYSSENDYVGIRLTGRQKGDPLGQMSFNETQIIEGLNPINSFSRFGDYCHMSVEEGIEDKFWYTTEFAGDSLSDSHTRIVSFQMPKENVDLNAMHLVQPLYFENTAVGSQVVFTVANQGNENVESYEVGFLLNGNLIETKSVNGSLSPGISQTISFDSEVVFENVNDQTLTLFVSTDADTNPNNDTIHVPIFNIIANNLEVKLSEITIPCGLGAPAEILIKNKGNNIISELSLELTLNNTQIDTINWQGTLDLLQIDKISFDVINSSVGANDLTVKVISVNNETDEDQLNNVDAVTFELKEPSTRMIFNLIPDNFPQETSWQLVSDWNDEIIYSGDGESLNNEFQLLPDSCYTFTIFDSEGDGICCGFGEGSYALINGYCDTIISSNGNFEDEESFSFCFESVNCEINVDVEIMAISQPGIEDGSFNIQVSNAIGPIKYSIDGGQTYSDDPIFTGLAQGDYDLVIVYNEENCVYRDLLSIGLFSSTTDLNNTNSRLEIKPNPNNGYFVVELHDSKSQELFTDLEIYDALGKLIERKRMQNYSGIFTAPISLVSFPNGHYYLRVFNKEEYLVETVIKNR